MQSFALSLPADFQYLEPTDEVVHSIYSIKSDLLITLHRFILPDESNPELLYDWLPKQARWAYLARSGLPAVSCKKMVSCMPYNIFYKLLTKLVHSRQLDIDLDPFCVFMNLNCILVHKHTRRSQQISSHFDNIAWSMNVPY